jgi:hypothetical protein
MPEQTGADKLRDALHAAVEHEPYAPMPAPVVGRARRRLGRNVVLTAAAGVVVAVSVAISGSTLSHVRRTTPANQQTNVPSVPSGACCLPPAESLLYQATDGSIGYARIDGQRGGTVLPGASPLAMAPDGSALLELTSEGSLQVYAGAHDITPVARTDRSFEGATIAPDGAHVAIATDGELIERTVGGTGSRVLVPVEVGPVLRNPAWSPDNRRIAYIRSASDNDLMVLDLRTGRSRAVLPSVAYAAWSPDGTHLVTARPAADLAYEIDIVDLQGNVMPVSSTPAAGFPAWSPDGARIAFIRSDGAVVMVGADGAGETAQPLPAIDRSFTTLLWVPAHDG